MLRGLESKFNFVCLYLFILTPQKILSESLGNELFPSFPICLTFSTRFLRHRSSKKRYCCWLHAVLSPKFNLLLDLQTIFWPVFLPYLLFLPNVFCFTIESLSWVGNTLLKDDQHYQYCWIHIWKSRLQIPVKIPLTVFWLWGLENIFSCPWSSLNVISFGTHLVQFPCLMFSLCKHQE